jgi:tyrosyl-tRNA synthetase
MDNNLENFFQELQNRGIISNYANLEKFYQLKSEEKIVYLGIDCTAESLHIGHLFLLIQTIRFAKEGFQILLVIGGATSKIGDPSDKIKERTQLETKKLENYQKKIKEQLNRILIEPRKIEKSELAPLELFYGDKPNLLNDIYRVLAINKEDSKEKM